MTHHSIATAHYTCITLTSATILNTAKTCLKQTPNGPENYSVSDRFLFNTNTIKYVLKDSGVLGFDAAKSSNIANIYYIILHATKCIYITRQKYMLIPTTTFFRLPLSE
jgi:hypothetical protein